MTESENTVTTQDNEVAQSTVRVIEVANPTADEMVGISEQIKVNYDFDVDVRSTTFNFKKSTDKDTGIQTDRKPVVIAVPYPTVQGILTVLETGGKGLELLLDIVAGAVNSAVRDELYSDDTLTASTFPVDRVSFEHIANIPKVQRRGGGIPKEIWEAFGVDYVSIMPEATGKSEEQVGNAAKMLVNKLSAIKTNKKVIEFLVPQLAIYADNSPNISEYAECVEFLLSKAEDLLNVSEETLLEAL